MEIHELKSIPTSFVGMSSGQRPFDIRKADRAFDRGDAVIMREWRPIQKDYTGRMSTWVISCVADGGSWGLPRHLCVLGLYPLALCRIIPGSRLDSRIREIIQEGEGASLRYTHDISDLGACAGAVPRPHQHPVRAGVVEGADQHDHDEDGPVEGDENVGAEGPGGLAVKLGPFEWAIVCESLQDYLSKPGQPKGARADALAAIREVDRVISGRAEPRPPDDLMPELEGGTDAR